jgi:protein TonB
MVGDPYLNMVYAKLMGNLRYPESFRRDGLMGVAHFELFVARSGEVVRVNKVRSSGNSAIDLYAEEVVRRLSPLPPIPARLVGEVIIIDASVPVGPSAVTR